MRFQTPLLPARLLRRYKRFLADIELEDGQQVTAHCPNPGSMLGLTEVGQKIWVEPNDDPRKKLKYGWRLVELEAGHFVGIDTGKANSIVREALVEKSIPSLDSYDRLRAEVKYGQNSRIDFLLSHADGSDCYVEVKSVTLQRQDGLAEFPDSVTQRGTKHLNELSTMCAKGHKAVMLYLIQRTDCVHFAAASDIDPIYANALDVVVGSGVEVICLSTQITPHGIWVDKVVQSGL